MPEHPLLLFPEPAQAERLRPPGGGGGIRKPSAGEQRERLDAKFQRIAESFQSIQPTPHGLEPEQVIVLETIGEQVDGLAKAAAQIPGLEWLAEMDLDEVLPEAGFESEQDPERPLPCRLYAVMTNQQAMDRLVGLWDGWCRAPAQRAQRGYGPFKRLFENLRDLRRWGPEDRIRETKLVQYLQEQLADHAGEIRFEVELWYRMDAQARNRAYEEVARLVAAAGGQCLEQTALADILYHGVLVKMPATAVRRTIDDILAKNYAPLVRCEDVMFFRPFAQAKFLTGELPPPSDDLQQRLHDRPMPSGGPIAALFDGLPLEQHVALRGRLLIDDVDGHESHYVAQQQQHGTAMASLVVHGDLNADGAPLTTPIYVRPILLPKQDFRQRIVEVTPDDKLLVDLIHRAVIRLFDGDEAAAPTVRLINLSFANPWQPFDRELSPLARLLDWLSWKYKVLFLVSAGNHADDIRIAATIAEWRSLSDEALRSQVLHAICREQMTRRPYSPAEAINVLTVGAIHADESSMPNPDRRIDLLRGARLPSPVGTVAHGFRRSVKPEISFPGGRQLYNPPLGTSGDAASFTVNEAFRPPGVRVAAPGTAPLNLAQTVHSRGTSNATAVATRCGVQISERLNQIRGEAGGGRLAQAELAVLVKCLLVHGASWGTAAEVIEGAFRDEVNRRNDSQRAWREMDRLKIRFLGYGEVVPERALFCTDERVTVLGWSTISADEGHVFTFPIPPALTASNGLRRLTVTLAWLSPINPRDRSYRQAYLWSSFPQEKLGVSRAEIDSNASRRGTVEHRVLAGKRILAIVEGDAMEIVVNCKADAAGLDQAVPYCLAVTLELAQPLDVSIFEQVRDRLRPRVEVTPERVGV